jgi:excisionase family DNA binding protein
MTTATIPDRSETAESPLYTVDQVAAVLQCSVRNIWKLADSGDLPGMVRIGRLVRWRKSDVSNWLAAGCPRPK